MIGDCYRENEQIYFIVQRENRYIVAAINVELSVKQVPKMLDKMECKYYLNSAKG